MNVAVQAPLYTAQAGDVLRHRDTVLAIWRDNLGNAAAMRAKYDWFYLRPGNGAPLLWLLRHEPTGDLVGACSAGRRRMSWRGRGIRAGVLVDLAVAPEHRSLGPALILQEGLAEAGRRELDLLYGFPNPRAAPVFKRIGYRHLATIVRHARALRHAGYFRRQMPAWLAYPAGAVVDLLTHAVDLLRSLGGPRLQAHWVDQADPRMDALWRDAPHGHGLLAVRDADHVRWRFDQCPLQRTRHLLLDAPDGTLSGWFATQVADGMLHVRDFWTRDAAEGVGRHYIDALIRAARAAGHAAVSVELAAPESHLAGWRSRGFVERSRRPVFGRWSWPDPGGSDPALFLTSADEDE